MATVLAVLTSGRKHGFTARLLQSAISGIESVAGVETDFLHTHDFIYGPCTSCFACVRSDEHVCVLDDDMGRNGEGEVFQRLSRANGIIIADPVHNWSPTASARLLIERCYPFVWSGKLKGMPAASISCASNQGMHRLARAEICKWLFGLRTRFVGGVAAHVAFFDRALAEAEILGVTLGRAALVDETEGRRPWDDAECFAYYTEHAHWAPTQPYIDNLTDGTMLAESSIMAAALQSGVLQSPEAVEYLRKAQEEFQNTVHLYRAGEFTEAAKSLAEASAYWTHATWKQFLEDEVIGVKQPEAYRPISEDE